jgi:predicted outer membrane repeat protein
MDVELFDRLTKALATLGTRRGLLRLVATLPVAGTLLTGLEAVVQGQGNGAVVRRGRRRRRRKKRHDPGDDKRRNNDKRKEKRKDKDAPPPAAGPSGCSPESTAQTCAGRCGTVTNACGWPVACAPCTCDPPCGACETCDSDLTCQSCALCCAGSCVDGACCDNAQCTAADPTEPICDADHTCVACSSGNPCPAHQVCLPDGSCRDCDVICTSGDPVTCGNALQTKMNGGGTLYVCPGRYRPSDSLGRGFLPPAAGVTLIGAGEGPNPTSNTHLDAIGAGRVLTINTGVGLVELVRLRVTGGDTTILAPGFISAAGISHGGGSTSNGSTLRMTECTVAGNRCGGNADACGVRVGQNRRLEMLRCTISDNHHTQGGGGIFSFGFTTLTDCRVENNSATERGGGILVTGGTLDISETCRVTQNTAAPGTGGGIRNAGGTVTLQGANPTQIVVNNCHENCVGTVPGCADTPVSC